MCQEISAKDVCFCENTTKFQYGKNELKYKKIAFVKMNQNAYEFVKIVTFMAV